MCVCVCVCVWIIVNTCEDKLTEIRIIHKLFLFTHANARTQALVNIVHIHRYFIHTRTIFFIHAPESSNT